MVSYDPQALKQINTALTLTPTSPIAKSVHVRILIAFGKLDEAFNAAEKVTELDPTYFLGPYAKIEALTLQGKYDEALQIADAAAKGFGNHPTYLTAKACSSGSREDTTTPAPSSRTSSRSAANAPPQSITSA